MHGIQLEMSKEQLVNRMLSMESNVDSQKLRTGTLTDSDWDAVVEGIGTIGSSKLIIMIRRVSRSRSCARNAAR